jgi:membrane protein
MMASDRSDPPVWLAGILLAGLAAFATLYERRTPVLRVAGAAGSPGGGAVHRGGRDAGSGTPRGDPAFGEPRSTDEPHSLQKAREPGRGREAVSPWQIPGTGWKDILWRIYAEIQKDRLLAVAAGVVYFELLALFPALTALVSSYGLFADAKSISDHLSLLSGILPAGAFEIIQDQVARLTSKDPGKLGFGFFFGLALALWSANAGMKAIIDALNVIYDEDEKRGFFKLNLVSLAFTFGAIATALLAIGAVVVLPLVFNFIGLGGATQTVLAIVRWPVLLLLVLFGLAVLYRFGPSRRAAQWKWVTPGSVFATFAWLAGSGLLSLYLSKFADYDATYGSLGAAMGLMMWMWMSSIVVLVGAEINAEIEHQTAQDTTTARGLPLGARDAAMADTVGEAQG